MLSSSHEQSGSSFLGAPEGVIVTTPHSQSILLLFDVRSLYPKLDFLKIECVDRKPDIVCLSETWLDSGITNDGLSIPDFNLIHLDKNRH